MNDRETTITDLKEAVHQLCLRKGWGEMGVQNPQQVAMAMTVEMSELLEHIQWMKAPGMELPVNPGPEGFRELIRAIRDRRMITYRYRVRGEQDEKEGK